MQRGDGEMDAPGATGAEEPVPQPDEVELGERGAGNDLGVSDPAAVNVGEKADEQQ